MSRIPAVADMFYPGDKERLREQVDSFVRPAPEPIKVMAAISPHAGYMYSGGVAGAVFSQISIQEAVVIIGPNHRGMGFQSTRPWPNPSLRFRPLLSR